MNCIFLFSLFAFRNCFFNQPLNEVRHSPLLKPADYTEKFQTFRKLLLQNRPKYSERRLKELEIRSVPQIPNIEEIKKHKMRKLMISLKTKDPEFYENLQKLSFKNKKRYLKINKERYLFDLNVLLVGGAAIGGGIFLSRFAQTREVKKIRMENIKVKERLAASRMNRRKDIESLQDSIVTLKTRLGFLKDIANTKGMDLINYIDSKVTG